MFAYNKVSIQILMLINVMLVVCKSRNVIG